MAQNALSIICSSMAGGGWGSNKQDAALIQPARQTLDEIVEVLSYSSLLLVFCLLLGRYPTVREAEITKDALWIVRFVVDRCPDYTGFPMFVISGDILAEDVDDGVAHI